MSERQGARSSRFVVVPEYFKLARPLMALVLLR